MDRYKINYLNKPTWWEIVSLKREIPENNATEKTGGKSTTAERKSLMFYAYFVTNSMQN